MAAIRPRVCDEPVEIGIFALVDGVKEADEEVMYLQKAKLAGDEPTLHFTVPAKPYQVDVDPYNKPIDRVPGDDRMTVTITRSALPSP